MTNQTDEVKKRFDTVRLHQSIANKKPLQPLAYKGLNMVGPVGLEPTTKGL